MKRVKVLIGATLAVIMVVAMLAISVSAAPMSLDVVLDADKVEVGTEVGATVTVQQPATNLFTFTVQILYNVGELELKTADVVDYPGVVESVHTEDGKINVNFLSENIADSLPEITNVFSNLVFVAKVADVQASISAAFPEDTMIDVDNVQSSEQPEYVQPGENTFSDTVVESDPVVVVPEGGLDNEEPEETSKVITSTTAPDNSVNIDVDAVIVDGGEVNNYKVIVAWEGMEFTYTTSATEWNFDTHMWDVSGEASWSGAGSITVTNHSSKPVVATASYAAIDGGNTDLAFTGNGATVAAPAVSADVENISPAPFATIGATVSAGTITATEKMGTITLAIENA